MSTIVQYVPKDPAPITQQDAAYVSDNGEIKATFAQDAQGQHVVEFEARGYTFRWIPREIKYIDPDLGLEDIIVSADNTSPLWVLRDYHARYDRHFPDVEEWFRVEGGKLKHYFSLRGDQRPPLDILQNPYLAVCGVLEYDPSLSVRGPLGMTMSGAFTSSDPIALVDADGREVFTLPAIVAWDQSSPPQVQRGTFFVEAIGEGRLEFSVGVPYEWLSRPDVSYPVIIDPTVVVASAYDTSGNGGRKIVRLSNGWIVATAQCTSSPQQINFYVSKDNGQTWSQLCYISMYADAGWAIASSGTVVYALAAFTTGSVVNFYSFDATTVTNTAQSYKSRPESGQTSFGSGVSLAVDGTGAIHSVWCSKNSTYPNSFNIRYSKSTDGGNTWATPTQVTMSNSSGNGWSNPCIVVTPSGVPVIIASYQNAGGNSSNIICYVWNGSNFTSKTVYTTTNLSYTQSNPCAAVDSNDVIHVVWHGKDATDSTYNNIRYAKSSDGGATWSSASKLTSGNTYDQQNPSITIDPNNKIRVFFQGRASGSYDQIRKIESADGGATWSSIADLTSNTTGHAQNPQTLWSKFNMNSSDAVRYIWQDNQANAVKYDSILLNSPPNVPTLTPKANFDATTAQTFQWSFSDPNQGDSQSAYQLQIVDTSTGQTVLDTGKVGSTAQSYTLAANTLQNGKRYQWRVMVWDQAGAASPWSAYSTFETAAAPSVSITSPTAGGTVATSSVTPQWSYSDPAGNQQATYQVQLLDANNVVLWDSGQQSDPQGAVRALTVGYTLANNTTYKVQLVVTNSKGVASAAVTQTFSTSFTPPATPTLTATAQNGYIRVAVTNPTPQGSQPVVAYNDIYRRETGTTNWVRIATNVPNNGSYDDYAAASGKQYDYKVTAVGNNGTSTDSAVASASLTLAGVWLHDPLDPPGTVRNFRLREQNRTVQTNYSQTMMQFEGRSLPVADIAGQKTQQVQVTISCATGTDDLAALYELIDRQTTLLYRDSRGRKIYGVVAAIPETEDWWGANVQLTIQAVDYQEAV
jgi:hypothetical protein